MRRKEAVKRRRDERESGSDIDRRGFLVLSGSAITGLASGFTGTATATRDSTVESSYGASGYGELSYGSA
jgi:hypothetical protein